MLKGIYSNQDNVLIQTTNILLFLKKLKLIFYINNLMFILHIQFKFI